MVSICFILLKARLRSKEEIMEISVKEKLVSIFLNAKDPPGCMNLEGIWQRKWQMSRDNERISGSWL